MIKAKKLSRYTDIEFLTKGKGLIQECVTELIQLCLKHKIPFQFEPRTTYHNDRIKILLEGDVWTYSEINYSFYWRKSLNELPIDELLEKVKNKYDNNR